jgi:heme-degrading monooxygenase HmoA
MELHPQRRGLAPADENQRKEVVMAVKILIKRVVKDGCMKDVPRLLINARNGAMQCKGYIASETWQRTDAPNMITVVSMWQTVEDWTAWKNSEVRLQNESHFKEILATEPEYESYMLGMDLK